MEGEILSHTFTDISSRLFVWIHMRYFSSMPVLDSESFSPLFTHFCKAFFEIGKCSISIWLHIDDRKDDFISNFFSEKLFIYLTPSADICFFDILLSEVLIEPFYRVESRHPIMRKTSACQNNILSSWQDSSYRLESFPPHDDRMSESYLFEVSEVFRYIPRYLPFISDDTIVCHSSNGDISNLPFHNHSHILLHSSFIHFYLSFERFESGKFLIFSNFKKRSHRYHLTIDISTKAKKMCFKKLYIFPVNPYTRIALSWDNPREAIGSRFEITTTARKCNICCRKSYSTTDFFSFYNDARYWIHRFYSFILSISARRLSPAIAKFGPIRGVTWSSVLQVRSPNITGTSYMSPRSMIPREASLQT